MIKKSPILEEIKSLSVQLSKIASIGLEALKYIRQNNKAGDGWVDSSLAVLEKAAEPAGEVKLMVILPIKKLVEYAGRK